MILRATGAALGVGPPVRGVNGWALGVWTRPSDTSRPDTREPGLWTLEPPVRGASLGLWTSAGSGAPIFTQSVRAASSFDGSLPEGGILMLPSQRRTRISTLLSGSPGTTAAPEAPPCSRPAGVSTRRPPWSLGARAEWQL